MRRVFDICHGCRRCFNLCDSFPRLFDLIDNSPSEDVEGVKSEDFAAVVEACTLCDMCFMTKCPYVPPHPFNLDFPHLMLRHRAAEASEGKTDFTQGQLAEMDRNGKLARFASPLVNWASDNEQFADAARDGKSRRASTRDADAAEISRPHFLSRRIAAIRCTPTRPRPPSASARPRSMPPVSSITTSPTTGMAARAVLNHIGVETKVAYPGCCGMPFLEQAELARVAQNAAKVSKELVQADRRGLRHRRADRVLRADAEIRMGADRAGQ